MFELPGRQKPYVMAHRGNRVARAENTLSAFQRAFVDGADIVETDLHLSRDGVLMCIHDATLDRTTDGRGEVAEKTRAELGQCNAAAARPDLPAEGVPTLRQLGEILPPDIALALELKTDRFLEPEVANALANELTELGLRDRAFVLSFSLPRLMAVKAVAADIPAGWIVLRGFRPPGSPELLGPFWPLLLLNPFYVRQAHRQGQVVCPLDPEPDSRLWLYLRLGCDAILTDDPASTCRRLGRPVRPA